MQLPYTQDAIIATAVLHNIATMRNSLPWTVMGGTDQPGDDDDDNGDGDSEVSDDSDWLPRQTRDEMREAGRQRRDNVVMNFFR